MAAARLLLLPFIVTAQPLLYSTCANGFTAAVQCLLDQMILADALNWTLVVAERRGSMVGAREEAL